MTITCPQCNAKWPFERLEAERGVCPNCKALIPKPGQPPGMSQAAAAGSGNAVAVLLAGLAIAFGPFLPWAQLGMLSATGLQKTNNEALALVGIGILLAIGGGMSLGRPGRHVGGGAVVLSLLAGGLSIYYYVAVSEHMQSIDIGAPAVGMGLYLCIVGSVVGLVASLSSSVRRVR